MGGVMIGHGAQKLFGWFGGKGLKGAYKMIEAMGYRPVWFWAWISGVAEFGGGVLLLFGFLTPLGSARHHRSDVNCDYKIPLAQRFLEYQPWL